MNNNIEKLTILMIILFSSLRMFSEDLIESIWNGIIKSKRYVKPLISEFHSSISKVLLCYKKSYAVYNFSSESEKFDRPMIELHLGFETPIFSFFLVLL